MATLLSVILFSLTASSLLATCPDSCRCTVSDSIMDINCSELGLQDIPDLTGLTIRKLNLSRNRIRDISVLSSVNFTDNTELILDSNNIQTIPVSLLSNIPSIRRLSIRNNTLSVLDINTFSNLKGSGKNSLVDLSENALTAIQGSAFAYSRDLEIQLSGSNLTIEPYAFYSIMNVPKILIQNVGLLDIQPGAFTNAEGLNDLEIVNVTMKTIAAFTFQGITDIDTIKIAKSTIKNMESYAFSSIHYRARATRDANDLVSVQPGGSVTIKDSFIHILPGDCFRDTNLGSVELLHNTIGRIEPYFVRGLDGIRDLSLEGNVINQLAPKSLGWMTGLRQVSLEQNDIKLFPQLTFQGIQDAQMIRIRSSKPIILHTLAFSDVLDVGHLQISGNSTQATIMERAFSGLVGVEHMELIDLDLPVIKKETFRGMSKILMLRIAWCNIRVIEPGSFGMGVTIDSIDLSEGNQPECDCSLLKQFESAFMNATLECVEPPGILRRVQLSPRRPLSRHLFCPQTDAYSFNGAQTLTWSSPFYLIIYFSLLYHFMMLL